VTPSGRLPDDRWRGDRDPPRPEFSRAPRAPLGPPAASPRTSLSVVVCTRDRPVDLLRCVDAIARSSAPDAWTSQELVIVDDGHLEDHDVDRLRERAAGAAFSFAIVPNGPRRGLFDARVTGVARTRGAVILFLDDDVTVAPDYLAVLAALYRRHPTVAGVGGVDRRDRPRPALVAAVHRLVLFDSGRPGALSPSGFPGSMRRWVMSPVDFASEYLAGSNMSFRRSAIAGLEPVAWLASYSLGEDLYLSAFARRRGPLVVSPALGVWHEHSGTSRDRPDVVARAQVVNMFHLLRLRGRPVIGLAPLAVTLAWFVLKDAVRFPRLARLRGYARGAGDLVRLLLGGA